MTRAATRPDRPSAGWRARIREHPLRAYFIGAYAFSWALWLPSVVSADPSPAAQVLLLIGVFGPWASAAIVARTTTGSARDWMRGIFRFRLAKRWYILPIAFPIALIAVASLPMAGLGVDLDLSLLADERLVAFIPTLLFCILLNGGPEEPGWRGFALPRLEQEKTPVRATIELGIVWGFWHLPLLFVSAQGIDHGLPPLAYAALILWTFVGIAFGYVFFYTYIWNVTRSVVPCILLHAAFNTANGIFLLVPEGQQEGGTYVAISLCLTSAVLIAAWGLVRLTHGRLGLSEGSAASPPVRGRDEVAAEVGAGLVPALR